MANLKHMNNEMAVSPVVATLVLIVVAVIGAVAVGTIMGTFSTSVSKQANTGQVSAASQSEILIAGSTTMYPASVKLAADYETQHPGIKVTVQQGGSGEGVIAAAMGIADIGSASSATAVSSAQTANANSPNAAAYANLVQTQIGGSAVIFITNTNGGFAGPVDAVDLNQAYGSAAAGNGATAAATNGTDVIPAGTIMFQRSDVSGTEQTVAAFVGAPYSTANALDASNALGENGNPAMLAAVQAEPATAKSIGFVDFGIGTNGGVPATGITVLPVTVNGVTYTLPATSAAKTSILDALKDQARGNAQDTTGGSAANYPQGLARPLFYITEGTPNSVIQNFIQYSMSPTAAASDIDPTGMFGITEFA